MKKTIISFLFLLVCGMAHSQVLAKGPEESYNADSIRAILDKSPYFTLFKDNYFIGGIPIGNKPTARNSDVKFQLSIAQRLTKSKLPFDTYLFLQYTQKAFWNVFQESLPMRDLNFNPGIGLGHLIVHKNKYIGKGYLMVEHESNGKDSIFSRSWNKITLAAAVLDVYKRQVVYLGYFQLLDVAGKRSLRNRESAIFQFFKQFFLVTDHFRLYNTANGIQSFLLCTHVVYLCKTGCKYKEYC